MTDDQLRQLVRQVLASRAPGTDASSGVAPVSRAPITVVAVHASHAMFGAPDNNGPCVIEPSVPCNHCGYCKSLGH